MPAWPKAICALQQELQATHSHAHQLCLAVLRVFTCPPARLTIFPGPCDMKSLSPHLPGWLQGIRGALPQDLRSIEALLKPLEEKGILAPRSRPQLIQDLPHFRVAERDGKVGEGGRGFLQLLPVCSCIVHCLLSAGQPWCVWESKRAKASECLRTIARPA